MPPCLGHLRPEGWEGGVYIYIYAHRYRYVINLREFTDNGIFSFRSGHLPSTNGPRSIREGPRQGQSPSTKAPNKGTRIHKGPKSEQPPSTNDQIRATVHPHRALICIRFMIKDENRIEGGLGSSKAVWASSWNQSVFCHSINVLYKDGQQHACKYHREVAENACIFSMVWDPVGERVLVCDIDKKKLLD